MSSEDAKVVRPVGVGNLFNTSRHALGICRRVCNTSRYVLPRQALGGWSLEAVIENAVAVVVMQHGILRVGIANEDSQESYFSFVDDIDLRDFVRWKTLAGESEQYDNDLLRSLEQTHDTLWDHLATRPGWEVIVHHGPTTDAAETITLDITFAFHHAYADGVASKLFHRDLLKSLNNHSVPSTALTDHVLHFNSPPDLLPGMETMVPFKLSWSYLLRTIWNEIIYQNLVPAFLKSSPPPESVPWTGEKISLEPHHVKLRMINIPQKALEGVLKTCREHDTTLTPLLHVLVLVSMARLLPQETAPSFSTTTPIDLRRYAKSEYDVINKLVGMVSAYDGVFDSSSLARFRTAQVDRGSDLDAAVWQEASSLSDNLRHKVSTLPNDDIVGMMSWVSDWKKFWTDKFGTKRGSTWEVSNIGSLKMMDAIKGQHGDNSWSIIRSMMTQGALPAGSAFSVNVAGVEGEGICLSLSWQESIVGEELMDGVEADLKEYLIALGDRGSLKV